MMVETVVPALRSAEKAIPQVDRHSETVEVRKNPAPSYKPAVPSTETGGVGEGPRGQKVRDRAHSFSGDQLQVDGTVSFDEGWPARRPSAPMNCTDRKGRVAAGA